MVNQCTFIGNLGADPEIRSFQSGGRVCNLRLAVNERWKDKDGQKQERTEWVPVSIFNDGLVGVCERFLRKGSKVYVQGQWATRKWKDKDGNDRYSTEVVLRGFGGTLTMLDGKSDGGSNGERREPDGSQGHADNAGSFADELSDDIPF